jgi:type I restriction enzyme S subunit
MKIQKSKWETRRVSDLFKIETGSTPSTRCSEYWDGGTVNWITPKDLSHNEGKVYISGSERKVTTKALDENNLTLLPKGSLILSTRAPVGYVAVLNGAAVFNQGCKGLVPAADLSPEFYYYCLISKRGLLENRSSGSTFKELPKDVLEKVRLPFPSLPEQKKIVEILSVVDERLKKVGLKLAKIERLKRELMKTLFKSGIGHIENKNSDVGLIPKEWTVLKLGDISSLKNGINFEKSQKNINGIPVVDVLNMYGPSIYLNLTELYRVQIEKKEDSEWFLRPGDVLFVRSSLKREGAGWASLFSGSSEPISYCGFIIRLRLNTEKVLPNFLVYYLRTTYARNKIISSAGQVTITNVSQDVISNLKIPVPAINEQKNIVNMLSVVDERLEKEKLQKEKLLKIKQSLIANLLSEKNK